MDGSEDESAIAVSTLSIVAITVFASLFVILSLAAASAVVYGQLQLRRQISSAIQATTDHQASLQLTTRDIAATLDSHRSKMDVFIQKINGEEISQAAKVIIASATRIERATIAFGELTRHLLAEGAIGNGGEIERAAASGLEPDSYAPNPTNERYTGINRTAQGDIEAANDLDDIS